MATTEITLTKAQIIETAYNVFYNMYDHDFNTNKEEFIEWANEHRYHIKDVNYSLESFYNYLSGVLTDSAKADYMAINLRSIAFNARIVEDDPAIQDKLESFEYKCDKIKTMDDFYALSREYKDFIKEQYQD